MNRLPVNLFRLSNVQRIPNVCSRAIHLSGINMNIIWRRNRRLPKNPTQEGPLTDLPDYTFMDGRPTPLGVRQKARLDRQRALAMKIVSQIKEVDFAKAQYQRNLADTERERQSIIDSKLKPKGKELLSKK